MFPNMQYSRSALFFRQIYDMYLVDFLYKRFFESEACVQRRLQWIGTNMRQQLLHKPVESTVTLLYALIKEKGGYSRYCE